MADLSLPVLVALALIGFAGGVGIAAVGPGGVLPTIGLFALTGLAPVEVAGTAVLGTPLGVLLNSAEDR